MSRIRLAAILQIGEEFAFMHRKNVKNHPIGDYYTFPGGGRENDESFEDGVKREIKEEFGIEVNVKKLLYKFENQDSDNKEEYFYLCEYVSGKFGTGDGPEFLNDPKYADRGEYIPEIIQKEKIQEICLLPDEIKEKFVKDISNGRFDKLNNKK